MEPKDVRLYPCGLQQNPGIATFVLTLLLRSRTAVTIGGSPPSTDHLHDEEEGVFVLGWVFVCSSCLLI